jgi:hypothetical protein
MITTTFKDFLEQGRLGPIVPGVTKKDEIRSWLGDGGNVDVPPKRRPKKGRPLHTHWLYGRLLEFAFDYDTLIRIGFTFSHVPDEDVAKLPEELRIEGYFPTVDTTLPEFAAYLDSEGIPHRIDPIWTWEGHNVVLAMGSARVIVSFDAATNKIDAIMTENVFPSQ